MFFGNLEGWNQPESQPGSTSLTGDNSLKGPISKNDVCSNSS